MTPKQIQTANDELAEYASRILNGIWIPLCITRVCVCRDNVSISKDPIGQFVVEVVFNIDESQRILLSSKDVELSIAIIKLHNQIDGQSERLHTLAETIRQLPNYAFS